MAREREETGAGGAAPDGDRTGRDAGGSGARGWEGGADGALEREAWGAGRRRRLRQFAVAAVAVIATGYVGDRVLADREPRVPGLPAPLRPVRIVRLAPESLAGVAERLGRESLDGETRCRRLGAYTLGLVREVEAPEGIRGFGLADRIAGRRTVGALYAQGRDTIFAAADDRATTVHEWVHAVDDQRGGRMAAARRAPSTDAQMALRAAIEGTAMLAVGTAPLQAGLTGDLDANAWVLAYGVGPGYVGRASRRDGGGEGQRARQAALDEALRGAGTAGSSEGIGDAAGQTAAGGTRSAGTRESRGAWIGRALALSPTTSYEVLFGHRAPSAAPAPAAAPAAAPRAASTPAGARGVGGPEEVDGPAGGERGVGSGRGRLVCRDGLGALGVLTALRAAAARGGPRLDAREALGIARAWRADTVEVRDDASGIAVRWRVVFGDTLAEQAWRAAAGRYLRSARSAVLSVAVGGDPAAGMPDTLGDGTRPARVQP